MAATFTTIGSQAFAALDETDKSGRNSELHAKMRHHNETSAVIADFSTDFKSSVEAKSAKARAHARWKMLRSLVHKLEFPKIKIADDKLRSLKRNLPKLEGEFLSRPVISMDWVSQLQDFWEQSNKNRQRVLMGRGPKKANSADPRSLSTRIRISLSATPRLFEPGSNFVVAWALFQAILLLYITIVVPFTAVFLADLDCFPDWSITVDLIIDTYFIADILVNAASPYKTQSGKMERHLMICVKRYIKNQFIPDAILSIPVAWMQVGLTGQVFCDPNAVISTDPNASSSSGDSSSLSLIRLPRLLRILRLLRIMKVLKLFDLKIFAVVKHIDPNIIALAKIMCFVVVFCHFLACIWWLVKQNDPNLDRWYDELNAPHPGTPVIEQYIACLYFVITTLTTVGYGDIYGTNDNERIFLVCVMFGGTLIFATIISNASQIVANFGASGNRHNAQLRAVFTFCKKWNVPLRQSNSVIDYYDAVATAEDENLAWTNVFLDVPQTLQCEISTSIVQNFFADNPLLSKATPKFLSVFFSHVKQVAYLPAQVICEEGSSKDPSILFIKSGQARLFIVGEVGDTDEGSPSTVHILKDYKEGEIIGLVSTVLWQPCLGTIVSVGQTQCFVLPRSKLLALFRDFPDFERDILDLAMTQLIKHTEALNDLKSLASKAKIATPKVPPVDAPTPSLIRRVSVSLQAVGALSVKSTAKVSPAPVSSSPGRDSVPTSPSTTNAEALHSLTEAEKALREKKLKQSCVQLSKLLADAKFEEMLLVVEGVNGRDRANLIRTGILGQVQHAVLVVKQLVLLHGIPSDVKVSSVIDESEGEESQKDQLSMGARAVPWKIEPGTSSHNWRPREASFDNPSSRRLTQDDASGSHAPQNMFTDLTDIVSKFCFAT